MYPAIAALSAGFVSAFVGYRIFHWVIAIWGFITGLMLGRYFSELFAIQGIVEAALMIALGVIGALVAKRLYTLGLILIGGMLGMTWSPAITAQFPDIHPLIIVVPLSLLFALLVMRLERPMIILLTTLAGSTAVLAGLSSILSGRKLENWYPTGSISPVNHFLMIVLWGALVGLGLYVQHQWTGHERS